jgi:hypothetical protein
MQKYVGAVVDVCGSRGDTRLYSDEYQTYPTQWLRVPDDQAREGLCV